MVRMMTQRLKLLREYSCKFMMSLSMNYESNNIEDFLGKLGSTLCQNDFALLFDGEYRQLIKLHMTPGTLSQAPTIEAILQNDAGNQIRWSACPVNVGEGEQEVYSIRGGITIEALACETEAPLWEPTTH